MGAVYSAFSGLPVPDKGGNNDVPYWLSQVVAVADTRLVLIAASVTERDSKYFTAPSGVLCVVRQTGTPFTVDGVYVKTSDVGTSVWATVWKAPAPLTPIDIPLADGFQATNGKKPVIVYNPSANTWTMWGNIATVNGTNIPSTTTLGSLPAAVSLATYQPYYEGAGPISLGGTGSPPGTAKISVTASGSINVYMGTGVQTNWVGLDGVVLPGA